ncbi:hypothetical protein C1H46_028915 [Malus baccata]|uniref:Uncharacterized protein n=1 Tax=Malus baccata TaxID=106549 RepID=A0A540LGR9_MALBA|nr:hypothetical protein C1H46_028915 [Malus baccata]
MKKRIKAKTSKASKSSKRRLGHQLLKSGKGQFPSLLLLLILHWPTYQFDPRTGKMLHFVEDNIIPSTKDQPTTFNFIWDAHSPWILVVSEVPSPRASQTTHRASLPASSEAVVKAKVPIPQPQDSSQATITHPPSKALSSTQRGFRQTPHPLVRKAALPRPPLASGVMGIPIPRPKKKIKAATSTLTFGPHPSIISKATPSTVATGSVRVLPPTLTFISVMASPPELVKKFMQIKTKLQSPPYPSEPQLL